MSVLVSRLDQKEGILAGRSECPQCSARLKWYDLFPVISFVLLKGRCRYCKGKISASYPLMEIFVAGSFTAYFIFNNPAFIGLESIYRLVLIYIFLLLAFFDHRYYILPDKIVFTGIAVSLAYIVFQNREILISSLFSGLGLAGFFAILYIISRGEWLGFGDVKLALFLGIALGYPLSLFSMVGSVWAGALWGIAMIIRGKADLKTALPFGTFICATAVIFIIFEKTIKSFISYAIW